MKPSPVRCSAPSTVRRLGAAFALAVSLFTLQAAPAFAAGKPFIVNSNLDTGDIMKGDGICDDGGGNCTLRAAIEEANNLPGATRALPHTITFSVPQVDITNGSFPPITAPVTITGPVFINGHGLTCLGYSESGVTGTGYETNGASGSILTGVAIGNCGSDAIDAGGHGFLFTNNFIGFDILGNVKPNVGHGIELSSTHTYGNFVNAAALDALFQSFPPIPVTGGNVNTFVQNMATKLATLDPVTISGNVISSNTLNGVNLHSENLGAVFVTGNWIGTDPTGKIAMPNGGNGVDLNGNTFGNLITGNVISGNTGNGVSLGGTVYLPNFVMNNLIGPPAAVVGTHIGNGMSGVYITSTPDTNPLNLNPSMTAAIVGPGNFISDNQGAPSNPAFPDQFNTSGAGVYVTGTANGVKVTGNTIGMVEIPLGTPQQTTAYGNAGDGVIMTANGNTLSGNVIAGNKRHGIFVNSTNAISNHITGNTIGQYPAFAADTTLGNAFDGVHIDNGSSTGVGGPNPGDGNTIIFNGRNGVKILDGGPNNGWSNLVQANTIYGNARSGMGGVGIDLDVTPNATDGPHSENIGGSYANLNQAPPVICVGAPGEQAECSGYHAASSAGGMTTIDWTIASHGVAKFHAEFYKIDTADDNSATSMVLLGTQDIGTTATGVPDPAPGGSLTPCPGGRCTATVSGSAAGAHVLMTITDVSDLLSTPGSSGWQTNLKCFFGDNGIILPACLANDTSEFSNVAAVVSSDASLSNLQISSGSLMPAFAANTLSYADSVTAATTSVNVTPTAADANATITVNGTAVSSGMASGAISLPTGPSSTPVTIVVTAQDGVTQKTYTVNVSRAGAASNNAALSNLTISVGTLTPAFASATLTYSDNVSNATSSVTVTPTTADANATVTVNGTAVTSGSASGAIALGAGPSTTPITVVVTAQDGTTMQTYTVNVNRAGAASNNANLSNLAISVGSLTPAFAANTLTYSDNVSNATASVTVTPTTADANATVKVNGTTVTSGSASGSIALGAGPSTTPITVVVTAQDGTTMQTYTVNVNRAGAASNNANLSNLTISVGSLTPAFASNTLAYSDNVSNATASVTVTPTTADANATVKVNGTTVTSGSASGSIALGAGPSTTPIAVVVTAQDGTTMQTYTVNVNRAGAASNNAALSNLTISVGSLTPAFASNTLTYSDNVSNATASVTVTPTTADANATVKVNGTTVTSGSASGSIALGAGPSTTPITVVVTAQDGTTMQTYTVNVNRAGAASNNAALSNLTISVGTLTPAFAANTLTYSDNVSNATASVTVTPTTADANATVKVNGTTVTSGSASGSINLGAGPSTTPITVVVTAQDGTTMQTYTVNVNRAGAASNNASLSNLTISVGSLTPAFASNTLTYSDNVSNATASVTVTPTTADANATVKVNGTTVTSGSASGSIALGAGPSTTPITVVVTAQDGTTMQTYTVNVNRAGAASNNASLSNLTISSGTLSPAFAGNTLAYTDSVANATMSVTVTPTVADPNATVKVNGTTVTSGSASGAIALVVGVNNISVVVTAQDGTTMQTYTIAVTRAAGVVTTFSGTTVTNTGTVTANISGGGATCTFASAALVAAPAAPPAGVSFPDGLFQFTLNNCVGTVTVHATFPTAFSAGEQYYKYGPTLGTPQAHWYALGAANNLVLSSNSATFTIADGGLGDDDLTVNGSIVDAGGPGVINVVTGNNVAATPTLSQWAELALMALLSLGGVLTARRAQRSRAR